MPLSLETDESTSIGEVIRLLRKEKRITQVVLAKLRIEIEKQKVLVSLALIRMGISA